MVTLDKPVQEPASTNGPHYDEQHHHQRVLHCSHSAPVQQNLQCSLRL